jgi:uncharacterized membrane protein YadS
MNPSLTWPGWREPARNHFRGILVSVVVAIAAVMPAHADDKVKERATTWFVVVFALLVAVNSAGWIPAGLQQALQTLSTWLLVVAMSAIGMKSQLKDVATVGFKPILLMVARNRVPGDPGPRFPVSGPLIASR